MAVDDLMERSRAIDFLAAELRWGTLVLYLGAGASRGAGLPDWPELVRRIQHEAGIEPPVPQGATADELEAAVDVARRRLAADTSFAEVVKRALYQDVALGPNLLTSQAWGGLPGALGALLMGSRRGSVRRVVTTNYDSMLEWYLSLHGYVTRVIHTLPAVEGAEDVTLYHPHGFLPHPTLALPDGRELLIGLNSVNLRLGTRADPWVDLMRHLLLSGTGLFAGFSPRSFQDRALAPLLTAVGQEVKAQRPTAVWLVTCAIGDERLRAFVENNVAPVVLANRDDLAVFLLEVAQAAAGEAIIA